LPLGLFVSVMQSFTNVSQDKYWMTC
jgi:hypothetical protein